MKPSALTALSAALLLTAGAPVLAQQQPPVRPPVLSTVTQGCVIAGPSFGDCRAVGRYSQSYRDVEGGLPRDGSTRAVASHADGTLPSHRLAAGDAGAADALAHAAHPDPR